jgi:hypothetical protein
VFTKSVIDELFASAETGPETGSIEVASSGSAFGAYMSPPRRLSEDDLGADELTPEDLIQRCGKMAKESGKREPGANSV